MIVFDLLCGKSHVFEAWFGSSADYEDQVARSLIACPMCGDTGIGKAAMAPAVASHHKRGLATPDAASIHAAMLAAQRRMEANSDYVGSDFPAEARAIDAGRQPPRSIYGEASLAEAAALADEGIALTPLPFRPLIRSDA